TSARWGLCLGRGGNQLLLAEAVRGSGTGRTRVSRGGGRVVHVVAARAGVTLLGRVDVAPNAAVDAVFLEGVTAVALAARVAVPCLAALGVVVAFVPVVAVVAGVGRIVRRDRLDVVVRLVSGADVGCVLGVAGVVGVVRV